MSVAEYVVIESWMVNDLGLCCNELLVYALVYGFTRDGVSRFYGSSTYIKKIIGIKSDKTVFSLLSILVKKGYLNKDDTYKKTGNSNGYYANTKILPGYDNKVINEEEILEDDITLVDKEEYKEADLVLNKIKEGLRENLTSLCYSAFFENLKAVKIKNKILYINCISQTVFDVVKRYKSHISAVIKEKFIDIEGFRFVVKKT